MTLFDFQLLSETEQVSLLYNEGIYIGKFRTKGTIRLLYQLDSFYVEVFYQRYRLYVHKIRCSASTAILDPYLEQIDVMSLVREP